MISSSPLSRSLSASISSSESDGSIEVLKPGTQEYEDKFGEQDRRTVRRDTERILRMEIEAYGFDYDEELARVRENSPGATSLSDDDLFWRLAEVWHRAMNS